jgi:nucleoside-diphosphate-sugar epimerase
LRSFDTKSALSSNVRRVVITSSTAAVVRSVTEYSVLDESIWNDATVEEVQSKGDAASPDAAYYASKTLAEKAAWEFMKKNAGSISFDLAAINPPFVSHIFDLRMCLCLLGIPFLQVFGVSGQNNLLDV